MIQKTRWMALRPLRLFGIVASVSILLAFTLIGASAMATEEPSFKVSFRDGDFEVREYPTLIAAEVTVGGDRAEASNAGFRLLAGYIFGGNTRKQSIAMTAPVVQSTVKSESIAMTAPVMVAGELGAWTVQFIMPSAYTLDTLPIPNDSRVRLKVLPPARVAVVTFSGFAHEPDLRKKTAELEAFTSARKLPVVGAASLARYNPPWTPWFMRRNELMVPLLSSATP